MNDRAPKTAAEVYPKYTGGYGPCNYQPIVDSFGTAVVQVDENDYQGDTWVLYRDGDRWGYLCFGWGSCSGCDSLQACTSVGDVDELVQHLWGQVKWGTRDELLHFFNTHDWGGDYHANKEQVREFREKALAALSND